MAALILGNSQNGRVHALSQMLADKLPDEYNVLVWSDGFSVHKDDERTLNRQIDDKEFHRLANFAQNHNLKAELGLFGGVPSVTLRLK